MVLHSVWLCLIVTDVLSHLVSELSVNDKLLMKDSLSAMNVAVTFDCRKIKVVLKCSVSMHARIESLCLVRF